MILSQLKTIPTEVEFTDMNHINTTSKNIQVSLSKNWAIQYPNMGFSIYLA